jgi:hypothetical protein
MNCMKLLTYREVQRSSMPLCQLQRSSHEEYLGQTLLTGTHGECCCDLQGCQRLHEQCLSHLVPLHQLSTFRCSMPLGESGLALLVAAAGSTLRLLEAESIEVQVAEPHAPPAPGPAAGAAAYAAAAAHAGGLLGAGGSSGSGSLGHLGPQLVALQVLQLRRVTSASPHLWQMAPRLTSLVVWGEASNTGLIRYGVCEQLQ